VTGRKLAHPLQLPVYVNVSRKRLEKTGAIFAACRSIFFIHTGGYLFIIVCQSRRPSLQEENACRTYLATL
jgi:hypothetical protein